MQKKGEKAKFQMQNSMAKLNQTAWQNNAATKAQGAKILNNTAGQIATRSNKVSKLKHCNKAN